MPLLSSSGSTHSHESVAWMSELDCICKDASVFNNNGKHKS